MMYFLFCIRPVFQRTILEKQVADLQQQVMTLSQGKAANFSDVINPHFVCDCAANSTFQFAFQGKNLKKRNDTCRDISSFKLLYPNGRFVKSLQRGWL